MADNLGVVYNVGTISTDIVPLNINWTTNNGATTFTGLKWTATNTAQAAGSKNFQFCGGASGANCLSIDPSGNMVTPGSGTFSAGSSTAGIIALGGGTQAGLTTNSFTISTQGTSSMTNWNANFPAAAGNGILNWTNSTNQVNGAFLTTAANGDLIVGNGTTWAKFAGNASGTKVFTEDASGNFSWAVSGSGSASTQIQLTKTANYTVQAGDFQAASTTAEEVINFTISSSTVVTATLPASAPALVSSQMPCVVIENSANSYPFELQINTNSLTLDGTAYGANKIGVDPNKSVTICSNGSNYVIGGGELSVFRPNFYQGSNNNGQAFAPSATGIFIFPVNIPQATVFGHFFVAISNPDAVNNESWALYSCPSQTSCVSGNGTLLCSVAATTVAAGISTVAQSACTQGTIVIPPGWYVIATAGAATTATYSTTGQGVSLWGSNTSTTTTSGGALSTVTTLAIPAAGAPPGAFPGLNLEMSLQQ